MSVKTCRTLQIIAFILFALAFLGTLLAIPFQKAIVSIYTSDPAVLSKFNFPWAALFENKDFADGKDEVDDHECPGEPPAVFFGGDEIDEQEEQARHELDDAREHVAGDELPRVALRLVAQDDIEAEEGDKEEKQHDEGHRRRGVRGKCNLHEDAQRRHNNGNHQQMDDVWGNLVVDSFHFLHHLFLFILG